MKKLFLAFLFTGMATSAWGFYDFCESPADYNTFPQAYDVRTEYWKDIPEYQPEDIKFKDIKNEHPTFPLKFKKTNKNKDSEDKKQ